MAQRRELQFSTLDAAIANAESLLETGYEQIGQWNLAQCCAHLNDWITYPLKGFPKNGLVMGAVLMFVRTFSGKKMLKNILANGFDPGVPTNPVTVYAADAIDEAAAVGKLRASVERFESFTGDMVTSPVFGKMDKDTVRKLQLRHFEHHLSYLVPQSN